jgi:cytochrome bd-type quinol oxidase subunit 1
MPREPEPSRKRREAADDLARWQYATMSLYHFLFVPATIGLAFLVAILQTASYRTDNREYKRITRFRGRLFHLNPALVGARSSGPPTPGWVARV